MRAEMRWVTAAFVLGGVIACRLSAGAADVGKLYVKSKPGRASVYLDQETDSRGNTPCYIRGVPVGEHTVRVHLSGYADVSEVVDVAAGTRSTVVLEFAERGPEDPEGAQDTEEADDTEPPAEEDSDDSGDETDDPDTGPVDADGTSKYIKVDCPVCSGTGLLQTMGCGACRGKGRIPKRGACAACQATGRADLRCPDCNGSGTVVRGEKRVDCKRCRGKGRYRCGLCRGTGKLKRLNPARSKKLTGPCVACKGTGFDHCVKCGSCFGKGQIVVGKHGATADCVYCDGAGKGPPRCQRCRGDGVVGPDERRTACMPCFATGHIWIPCGSCKGKGWQVVVE